MSETPGNMVRETVANIQQAVTSETHDDFAWGWDSAIRFVARELEELTSKVEGYELKESTDHA